MAHTSIFDIAGPIMVGPSSSHTAGACKIGQLAQAIFDDKPDKVTFLLHGSFATVTQGHATDRALLGGIMKFKTSDPRIKEAFKYAKKFDIQYEFQRTDLGPKYHPNTVKIILEKNGKEKDEEFGYARAKRAHAIINTSNDIADVSQMTLPVSKKMSVTGSSLGGGMVMICEINDHEVDIRATAGKYKSLIISHKTFPTPIKTITDRLEGHGLRIREVQSNQINGHSLTIINFDSRDLRLKTVLEIEQIPGVEFARSLTRLKHD